MARSTCVVRTGKESEFHMLLIRPEMQSWREELLKYKRLHVNDEMSHREILTVNKVSEQGNLGTLAYKVKCKREDQVKKEILKLREGHEGDCT